jgi:predicted nucleic acid-binding protein
MELLDVGQVLVHPFVIGELALGKLRQRDIILGNLRVLPHASVAAYDELLDFVERRRLVQFRIGYVDAHLLAATQLTAGATLWTHDKALRFAAKTLGLTNS